MSLDELGVELEHEPVERGNGIAEGVERVGQDGVRRSPSSITQRVDGALDFAKHYPRVRKHVRIIAHSPPSARGLAEQPDGSHRRPQAILALRHRTGRCAAWIAALSS